VPDWVVFLLLLVVWAPPLVVLHELAHAFAAIVLTDGDVSIGLRRAGIDGGWATYDLARLRRPRDEAWIAGAGPAASFMAAAVLWFAWLDAGPVSIVTPLGIGALVATTHFVTTALPVRYGRGLGGTGESDGRAVWRVLTGAPPRVDLELREPFDEPESATRPVFVVLLVLAGVLGLLVDPVLVLELAALVFVAILLRR
jgi:hypothetical protein